MKKIFLLLSVALAAACATETKEGNILNVVPYPNEVQMGEGVFDAKGAAVTYDQAIEAPAVNVITAFAEKLSVVSGVQNAVSAGTADNGFVFVQNDEVPSEAYVLDVKPGCVKVEASGLRGFNYAIQTIKQMLPVEIFGNGPAPKASWTIPAVYVKDEPRFAYRGMHLDECRHFFGIDEVKRYLDVMEIHKLNKFHWHLTEDQGWRIEIKKYPRLTEVGSIRKGTCIKKDFTSHDGVPYGEGMWYTQDQIREVVAYAAAKGIDVIPEIDLPGHMIAALAAYPELGCTGGPYEVWTRWGVSEDLLCAGNEKVYEFLEDVLEEICELFPYEYIHIGGDECPKIRWEQCPKCQAKIKALGLKDKNGYKAEHYLQSYVMSRMTSFLNGKGRKVIGWDELLEGDAPNATIMSWRGEQGGLEATRLGHDAIMTPNTYFYLDYYQSADVENEPFGIGGYLPVERCYSYEPYPKDMTDEQKTHILGVQANMWTEYIAEADHLYYMLLPRLAALSEVQWCAADRKDWGRFQNAAGNLLSIYDVMGYNYATHILQVSGDVKADVENNCAIVEMWAPEGVQIKYTMDGSKPGKKSATYTEPLKISESCVVRGAVIRDGMEPREFVRRFDFHKAIGKKVTISAAAHRNYAEPVPYGFVDGIRGTSSFKGGHWIGWHNAPVDIVVDMGETEPYSSVAVGMLSENGSHIFYPTRIVVSVSEDGENYSVVASQEYEVNPQGTPDSLKDFTFDIPETAARFVKVYVEPLEAMPDWHDAAGHPAFHFVDEIIVR